MRARDLTPIIRDARRVARLSGTATAHRVVQALEEARESCRALERDRAEAIRAGYRLAP